MLQRAMIAAAIVARPRLLVPGLRPPGPWIVPHAQAQILEPA